MLTVVAAVVHGKRAFLGGAATRVVGVVGVVIAHARAPGRFGAAGPACPWQTQLPAVNAHTARGLGSMAPLDL
jgi:hypothetical protein